MTTYYQRNRDRMLAAINARNAAIREMLRDAKNVPCQDCGVRYHYCVMDFDHREDETKSFNVSRWKGSFADIEAEIGKCDVVCSNCHRLRTFVRREK